MVSTNIAGLTHAAASAARAASFMTGNPEANADFGSFKLCGEGKYPKTFLLGARRLQGRNFRLDKSPRRVQSPA